MPFTEYNRRQSSCGHSYLIGSEPRKYWCIVSICVMFVLMFMVKLQI